MAQTASIKHGIPARRANAEDRRRQEFGGFNIGAAFFGWLSANSLAVLLIALLSALGSAVALTVTDNTGQLSQSADSVGIIGAILLIITFAVAYFAGGYVAGRMSRFDGGRQGLGVWIFGVGVTILLGLLGVLLGSNYNLLQQFNIPSVPIEGSALTTVGTVTLLAILVASIIAAISGGKVGERYHHKVDEVDMIDEDRDLVHQDEVVRE